MLLEWIEATRTLTRIRQDLALVDAVDSLRRADWMTTAILDGPEMSALRAATVPAEWHPRYYASAIVATYGVVERFVTAVVPAAARQMMTIVEHYDLLPEQVREQHLQLSLRMAHEAVTRSTGDVDVQGMVSRLGACISGTSPATLNDSVFAFHTANLRGPLIEEIVCRLGISRPARLGVHPGCRAMLDGPLNGIYADAASVLADLADRRNDVAHGQFDLQLLDRGTLHAVVDFVEFFLADVWMVCAAAVVELGLEHSTFAGEVKHTYSNADTGVRSIASVVIADGVEVETGEGVVVWKPRATRRASVVTMQTGGETVLKARGDGRLAVGLDLGTSSLDGCEIYVPSGRSYAVLDLLETAEELAHIHHDRSSARCPT